MSTTKFLYEFQMYDGHKKTRGKIKAVSNEEARKKIKAIIEKRNNSGCHSFAILTNIWQIVPARAFGFDIDVSFASQIKLP